ncbi:MAG: molecular chaperone DnaJ [Kiloniellales bacterium]
MAKRDFYEVLGVDRNASPDELKQAYRKLAMQHHPDRNPHDKTAEQKFKEVNEAYDVLKDDQQRAAYDRYGHAAFEQAGPGAGPGGFGFRTGFGDIFEEMFSEFMGGRDRGRQGAMRGSDLRYNLQINLEEAFKGKEASIRVPTTVSCESCGGSGAEKGSRPVTCRSCQGAGRVRMQQGFFTIERTCPTCHGAGRLIENPCRNCGGGGRVRREQKLSVSIPAGVEDGTRMRLAGKGEAGLRGAPPGDLYVFVSIAPHDLFQRDGSDIYCQVPIPMTKATLGGQVEVPTVDSGRARVTIPPGTQAGHQFRLRGKGMSVLRSPRRGDMYIQAQVETPVNLTRRQRELLQAFEEAGGGKSHSPEAEGFFTKVRELWDDLTE